MDFCDLENRSRLVATEKQLLETGLLSKEVEEDLNMAIGDTKDNKYENYDEENSIDNNEDSGQDSENENLLSDGNLIQDNKEISSEETNRINKSKKYVVREESKTINKELNHSNVSEQSDDESLWEDIYGRQRDKKGNIVPKKNVSFAGCSISNNVSSDSEKIRRLEREMRRILNRLGEGNMQTSAKEVVSY